MNKEQRKLAVLSNPKLNLQPRYWNPAYEKTFRAYMLFGGALICTIIGFPFGLALMYHAAKRRAEHWKWEEQQLVASYSHEGGEL